MKSKSIGELIDHHKKQAELYSLWAAIAEEEENAEKTAAYLELHALHTQWAEELQEEAVSQIDQGAAITRTVPIHPLFAAKPLNDNHARHA